LKPPDPETPLEVSWELLGMGSQMEIVQGFSSNLVHLKGNKRHELENSVRPSMKGLERSIGRRLGELQTIAETFPQSRAKTLILLDIERKRTAYDHTMKTIAANLQKVQPARRKSK